MQKCRLCMGQATKLFCDPCEAMMTDISEHAKEMNLYSDRLEERMIARDFIQHILPKLSENNRKHFALYVNTMTDRISLPPEKIPEDVTFLHEIMPSGSWEGRRCFILGGGPSLLEFPQEMLSGELVIGINRSFSINQCLGFSLDERFYKWMISGELGADTRQAFFDALCLFVHASRRPRKIPGIPKGKIVNVPVAGSLGIPDSLETGIYAGGHSGYAAISLALVLRANPIYLVGYDLHSKGGNQTWWHDGYPQDAGDYIYSIYLDSLERLSEELRGWNVQIYNLNRKSAVRCFPFMDPEHIEKKRPFPMIVSYYTDENYRKEAQDLIASCVRWGLEYDIRHVPSFGSWQKNAAYKPRFLLHMMEEYPDRDLCWIDADAVIRRFPEIFEGFMYDIAFHMREGRELLTGTLYLANNEATKDLCFLWERMNKENPDTWEQRNLQKLLGQIADLDIFYLPQSYCKIYDLMQLHPNDHLVIEHFQASRRYRHDGENKGSR